MSQPLLSPHAARPQSPIFRGLRLAGRPAGASVLAARILACALALAGASAPAFALQAGDDILSLGVAAIHPDASLGTLTSTGALATAFNAATAGSSADVSRETTVSFSWLHLFTDRLGAEFTLGVPPRHEVDLRTPSPFAAAPTHPRAATLRTWTPAAVGKWFFGEKSQRMRPYLGLGVSHVSFHELDVNRGDPTVALLAGASADLASRWTPVYNAGLLWRLDERWSVNASVSFLPIRTTATFTGTGPTTTRGDLKLDTVDWVLRLGRRF